MNTVQNSASPAKGGGVRVSLACIPCRTQHVRCDAKKPYCDRCSAVGKQCHYANSRRGGLTQAALAARRNRAATTRQPSLGNQYAPEPTSQPPQPESHQHYQSPRSLDDGYMSQTETSGSLAAKDHFHRCHPFVVPQNCLQRLFEDKTKQANVTPLISVMRFIGSLYAYSNQSCQLREQVTIAIAEAPRDLQCPFMVQCHLLYSIALYWSGEQSLSRDEIDTAIRIALNLAMNRRQFAVENGNGDPILQESWRRTWWQIYIVDADFAAIKRAPTFPTMNVEVTTELPCEEAEYASGAIPCPKTLDDFNSREFAPDNHVYSSFAYLIGAIHGICSAISRVLTGSSYSSSPGVLEAVDTMIDGWMLMVPESKANIFSKSGEIDEHMFHAYMAIHAATVGLHRPFSELLSDPLESISSCAAAPSWPLKSSPGFENVHTARCLLSIEAQVRLLALPAQPFSHTPFTVCMLTTGTISLLSACKFLLQDQKLAVARDQVRMSIGCLKSFAGVWPLAGKSHREVQTIAREMLGLQCQAGNNVRLAEESLADNDGQPRSDPVIVSQESLSDRALSYPSLDTLQTYWDLSDLQTDISAWFTTY
ncbi:hypothetical protein V490_03076 [Pseudogymnoascus sp. VKM F-3557]|nr:hypothetical protein V490_03076 [Pseudogymnoascus sp. VKM F-3557]